MKWMMRANKLVLAAFFVALLGSLAAFVMGNVYMASALFLLALILLWLL